MGNENRKQKPKLLVLSVTQSFLTRSMQDKLKELHIESEQIVPTVHNISGYANPIAGMVLFTSDVFLEDKNTLVYIKDICMEKDIPVFVVGKSEEISILENNFPEAIVKGTFMRPVDINEVVSAIQHYFAFFKTEHRRTILAIDDSGTVLRNIKGMFENKYQVFCADSAAMAIKSITLHKPDLILLDYDLPIVDGRQIFQMLKSEKDFADIPVMFLTGKDDADTVTSIMSLKPVGYMLKRMPAQQIVSNVDGFFQKSKAQY